MFHCNTVFNRRPHILPEMSIRQIFVPKAGGGVRKACFTAAIIDSADIGGIAGQPHEADVILQVFLFYGRNRCCSGRYEQDIGNRVWIVSAGALAVVVKFVFCNGKIRPFTEVYNGKRGYPTSRTTSLRIKKSFGTPFYSK